MTDKIKHISVLLDEAINGLEIKPNGTYLDLTLGRGGHSLEILKRLTTGRLIAVDQDEQAISESKERLKPYSSKVAIVRDNFVNIASILDSLKVSKVDGVLMDLGVSSPQFDEGDRGFSYKEDAILDMRMDQRKSLTAKTIINTYSLNELTKVFKEYGEDKYSFSIAKNIVKARETKEISTTTELVEIIKASKPMKELKKVGHPAKQIFQALRIEVNDELTVLAKTLKSLLPYMNSKGRIAVITFHSLEDRIVKHQFMDAAVEVGNRSDYEEVSKKDFTLVTRHPIVPTDDEIARNNRARSAKLRIIEKK